MGRPRTRLAADEEAHLIREFLRWNLADKERARTTARTYVTTVRTFSVRLRAKGANLLSATSAQLCAASNLSPARPQVRNTHRHSMLAWYEFLSERGLRSDNPAVGMPKHRIRQGIPRPLTYEERAAYLEASERLGGAHPSLALLGLLAALRIHEAAKVQWTDLDLHSGYVFVRGKGGHERIVPLHARLVRSLLTWREECSSPSFVFPIRQYGRWTGVDRPMSPLTASRLHHMTCDEAGLPRFGYHKLRHTGATEFYRASGGDLLATADYLGHISIQNTKVYAKVNGLRVAEVVREMSM